MDDNRKRAGLELLKVAAILVPVLVLVVGGLIVAARYWIAAPFESRLPASASPRYTMETFSAIRTGAPFSEVTKLTGSQGQLSGQTSVGGIDTQAYTFSNHDGSGMMVMIQNGLVVSKNQYGLR